MTQPRSTSPTNYFTMIMCDSTPQDEVRRLELELLRARSARAEGWIHGGFWVGIRPGKLDTRPQSVTVKQSCCKSLLFMNNLWAKWQLSKIHIFDIVSIFPMYWLDICIFMRIFNKWWAPHLGGQWIRTKPEGRAIVERQLGEAQAPIGCFGCFETPRYGVTDSHTDRHTFEIIYLYLRENSSYKWNCVFFSCWFW